jgi:2-C-methyl-D-erythritol 4-phosphate cytidylyltransferase
VAAVLLAGGMGTRLGSDDPKGMYNIGETKDVYIFQRIVENLMDVVKLVEKDIYLFVMTSDKNHNKTVNFFKKGQKKPSRSDGFFWPAIQYSAIRSERRRSTSSSRRRSAV